MYYHPFHQIVIIFCLEILMVAYFIKFRPFKSELQQVIVVSDEFTIVFALIFIYFLFKNQNDMEKCSKIAFGIIGVVGVSLAKNMGVILYINSMKAYTKLKKWVHKKFQVKANIREIKRLNRQKHTEEEMKQLQEKELLASLFRGNLRPDQILQPGEPSIINSMIRVDRPPSILAQRSCKSFKSNSLKKIVDQLQNEPNQLSIRSVTKRPHKWINQKFIPGDRLCTITEAEHNEEDPHY